MSEAKQPVLSEAEVARLRRLSRLGVVALGARTVVLQGVIFGSAIVLVRLLSPKDFGVFSSAQFVLSFFTLFGDGGVGGALIQQPHEPTQRELSSVFFFQLAIVSVLIALVFCFAGFAPLVWKDLPPGTPWLIRALAANLLMTALRVVPAILLERQLAFGRLAVLDVIVQLSFLACALPMAAMELGVWALVGGTLCQGAVSLVGAYILKPWRPSLVFEWKTLSPIVKFGLIFQAKNAIGFINGASMPLYAGHVLGLRTLGLLNWAKDLAWAPLRLVEILARVDYPLYSRLQADRRTFGDMLGRSVLICGVIMLAYVGIILGLGPNITRIVFGEKWLPGLPFLYLFALSITVGYLSPIVGAALDAVGKPGIIARLTVFWTVLNWIAVAVATPRFGAVGFAVGYIVHVCVGNLAVMVLLMRLVPEARFLPRMVASAAAAAATFAVGHFLLSPWAVDGPRLAASLLVCLAVFCGGLVLLVPSVLRDARAVLAPNRREPSGGPSTHPR